MKIFSLTGLFTLAVLLCSCSSPEVDNPQTVETTEESSLIATPSREALFVYNDKNSLPKKICLVLGGEPSLLPSGYTRLVGVVSGDRRVASLEIGGRGLSLSQGESVDGYQVKLILVDRVILCKNGGGE